jgi:hypothetical protein
VTAPDPLPGIDDELLAAGEEVLDFLDQLDDLDDCCECDDCLAPEEEPAVRPMVTLQPRSEFL